MKILNFDNVVDWSGGSPVERQHRQIHFEDEIAEKVELIITTGIMLDFVIIKNSDRGIVSPDTYFDLVFRKVGFQYELKFHFKNSYKDLDYIKLEANKKLVDIPETNFLEILNKLLELFRLELIL